jgi:hypothetical protein
VTVKLPPPAPTDREEGEIASKKQPANTTVGCIKKDKERRSIYTKRNLIRGERAEPEDNFNPLYWDIIFVELTGKYDFMYLLFFIF